MLKVILTNFIIWNSNDYSGFADLTEIFLTKMDKPPKEMSPKKQSPKKISKNNLLEAISQSSESDDDSSDDQFSHRFNIVLAFSCIFFMIFDKRTNNFFFEP